MSGETKGSSGTDAANNASINPSPDVAVRNLDIGASDGSDSPAASSSTQNQQAHSHHRNDSRDKSSRHRTTPSGAHDEPNPGPASQPPAPLATAPAPAARPQSSSTTPPGNGHGLPFVKPSSYLRRKPATTPAGPLPRRTMAEKPALSPLDRDQMQGLRAIREFLKVRTSYDVLPLSFRLIVLDTSLLIKKSLNILIQNNIVSAPLWDTKTSTFAGLLTSTDYINVIQYYCQFPGEINQLDQFRLTSLRDIEKAIGVAPLETVSCNPMRPLYEACRQMLKTRARRIPLIDTDDETGRETVVSVITQYRILKFIAVNNEHNTVLMKKSVKDIGLGTYSNLTTARMDSTVLEVVHLMVQNNISCIPIVDEKNRLLNAFEAVDIIPCIRGGVYEELSSTIGEALCKRSDDAPGIYTCTEDDRLDSIFDTIRMSRLHRLIVVDDDNRLKGETATINFRVSSIGNDVDDRLEFVHEYNRLARNHNVRLLKVENFKPESNPVRPISQTKSSETLLAARRLTLQTPPTPSPPRGWISRLFRNVSGHARNSSTAKNERGERMGHKRSLSDMATHITKRDQPKEVTLEESIRICGKSLMYLPPEYAPAPLVVPTSIRATAHYLIQNAANASGVFRVPGSVRMVNALYDHYYFTDKDGSAGISRTVRSVSLPTHMTFSIHDVASTFKRFLSILPGGILGSLEVFDAFVAIHSQVRSNPQYRHATKARLIALAVGTVQSHLNRELICAVFGLLAFLVSAAEASAVDSNESGGDTAPPNKMSYEGFGIVFGPLLVGDLLSSHNTKLADPADGLFLFPATPPMSKKEKQQRTLETQMKSRALAVDKVWVANEVATMIIRHWKEAVEYMRGYGVLRPNRKASNLGQVPGPSQRVPGLSSSLSEPLISCPQEDHRLGSSGPEPGSTSIQHHMPRSRGSGNVDVKKTRSDTPARDDPSTSLSPRRSAPLLSLGLEVPPYIPKPRMSSGGILLGDHQQATSLARCRESSIRVVSGQGVHSRMGLSDPDDEDAQDGSQEGRVRIKAKDGAGPLDEGMGKAQTDQGSNCGSNALIPEGKGPDCGAGGIPSRDSVSSPLVREAGDVANRAQERLGNLNYRYTYNYPLPPKHTEYTAYKPPVPSNLRGTENTGMEPRPLMNHNAGVNGVNGGSAVEGRVSGSSSSDSRDVPRHPRDALDLSHLPRNSLSGCLATPLERMPLLSEDSFLDGFISQSSAVASGTRKQGIEEEASRKRLTEQVNSYSSSDDQVREASRCGSSRSGSCLVGPRNSEASKRASSDIWLEGVAEGWIDDHLPSETGAYKAGRDDSNVQSEVSSRKREYLTTTSWGIPAGHPSMLQELLSNLPHDDEVASGESRRLSLSTGDDKTGTRGGTDGRLDGVPGTE
ncbi:uncharacterized protein DNG_09590 [Cephalotrichum gorgonifer]|uniref:Uncharacterized protein n=1 Tax=Cephalotrichum gorgonifer TaxID=2041049 RepID=A0AAE8N5Z6_9PEZI|nr:uncharacterized protein DNG_09590 [Cephalotrichum gorgonifer]